MHTVVVDIEQCVGCNEGNIINSYNIFQAVYDAVSCQNSLESCPFEFQISNLSRDMPRIE